MNAITYKEIFPLIKDNQLWAGFKPFGGGMDMIQTEDTFDESKTKSYKINDKGEIIKNIMGCIWFTNLTHSKRTEPIDLYKKYNADEYPKYDNYDAIEVGKVSDIPMDYDGVIGVPITFLGQYCPTQFEIIKFRKGNDDKDLSVNGKCPYFRILIRKLILSKMLMVQSTANLPMQEFVLSEFQSRKLNSNSIKKKTFPNIWFLTFFSIYLY